MARYRNSLPFNDDLRFIQYAGMETDLIYTQGVGLDGFAAYPLLRTRAGEAVLASYARELIALARGAGVGVVLDTPTWVANRDRGAAIGETPATLARANRDAVALIARVRQEEGDLPTVLSLNVGPRGDAYAPHARMGADEAEDYHRAQIEAVADTEVDMVTAMTLAYPEEAIGISRAAAAVGLPVAISFTVETDGRLPVGVSLAEAIATVDWATAAFPAYYMVNCAHPEHIVRGFTAPPARLGGLVVNASRCSHAELDGSETLDDGNPAELGAQVGAMVRAHPSLFVVGGCCGTDARHMRSIVSALPERALAPAE